MWINENLTNFIDSCSQLTKNNIYISDLKNIRISTGYNKGYSTTEKLVSRELLQNLLLISTSNDNERFFLSSKKEDVIPIIDDKNLKSNFKSQIILPLQVANEFKGSLIVTSTFRELTNNDLDITRSFQTLIEISIKENEKTVLKPTDIITDKNNKKKKI